MKTITFNELSLDVQKIGDFYKALDAFSEALEYGRLPQFCALHSTQQVNFFDEIEELKKKADEVLEFAYKCLEQTQKEQLEILKTK